MSRHKMIHSGEKLFNSNFSLHRRKKQSSRLDKGKIDADCDKEIEDSNNLVARDEQELKCRFCGEVFDSSSRDAFEFHQLQHELKATVPTGIGYVCFQCDATFDLASELVEHAETCTE